MTSVRASTTVTVISTIDGSRPRKARRRGAQRASRVATYRIHSDVLRAALLAAEGDPGRLDWSGAAVRDGVITMIRVLNHRRA